MLAIFRNWILGLAGAAIFCAVITELCPSGSTKKVLKLMCSVVMSMALLTPFINTQLPSYSLNMAKYRAQAEEISSSAKENAENYSRSIIEEQCRAYILDKALALGLDVKDAEVRLRWNEGGFWYPTQCVIDAEYDPTLAEYIECELGLGEECQEWRTNESD